MGALIIPLTVMFLVIAGGTAYVFDKTQSEMRTSISYSEKTDSVKTAVSGLSVAKDALSADDVWGDCEGSERYCSEADDYGYYPLFSETIGKKMEDAALADGKVTVLAKADNSGEMKVISIGEVKGKKTYFGVKFQRIASTDSIPLAYGGSSSTVYRGRLCSYYWNKDTGELEGATNPNFSVYLDRGFNWSPDIYVPRNPAYDNPKDVKFTTNFSTIVQGYSTIDKVFTTGDLEVRYGANVPFVYANGEITVDGSSHVGEKVEHGNLRFPDFKKTFEDNRIRGYSGAPDVYCVSGVKTLNPGTYGNVYVSGNCTLRLTGSNYKFKNLSVTAVGTIEFSEPDTLLESRYIRIYNKGSITYHADSRDSFITIRSEDVRIGLTGWGWGRKRSGFVCSDPLTCLIDVNSLKAYRGAFISGTVIARTSAELSSATFVGNLFAESLYATYSTMCNAVDENGHQLLADKGFFDIVDPDKKTFPAIITEVKKIVCRSVRDCDERL